MVENNSKSEETQILYYKPPPTKAHTRPGLSHWYFKDSNPEIEIEMVGVRALIPGSIHFTPVHFLPIKICTYFTFYPQFHSFYPHFPKIRMSLLTSHSQSLVVHVYLISHVSPHILHLDVWGITLWVSFWIIMDFLTPYKYGIYLK